MIEQKKIDHAKSQDYTQVVRNYIKNNKVMVFSKDTCPFCHKLKMLFKRIGLTEFEWVEVNRIQNGEEIYSAMKKMSGRYSVPNVYINGKNIGGCDETH